MHFRSCLPGPLTGQMRPSMGTNGPLATWCLVQSNRHCRTGDVPDIALRTVIVDDEPIARQVLEEELAEIPGIEIVGRAGNGTEALDLIPSAKPDLVLLDIQMPGLDGFEVVKNLTALPPAIVFVTAYDQHALRAFEVGAADYLLKPVRQERLREAISRVRSTLRNPLRAEALARTLDAASGRKKVVGKKGAEYFLLDLEEVVAFRAEGELVWIITRQKRYLANCTLYELARRFAGTQFRRIHRSALVNVDHVRKMSALSSQRWLITMSNDLELVVSKRQSHAIRQVLHA